MSNYGIYNIDANGNITFIYKGSPIYETYSYDSLNQLSSYTNANGDRYEYTYKNGNILTVSKNGVVEKTYGYNDANWPDKLTSFNGHSISYHYNTGNPSNYYDGKFLNWSRGRQLSLVGIDADTYVYVYDANGNRVSKTKNGQSIARFHMVDGVILEQTVGSDTLSYYYDEAGRKLGFRLNDTTDYYYEYNLQGDVIGIFDSSGAKIVTYTYDPWGKLLETGGTAADTIGLMNPVRYRGYYYDSETGFYYVSSRYYDPEVCRFINSDSCVTNAVDCVYGFNMFNYCGNAPLHNASISNSTNNASISSTNAGMFIPKLSTPRNKTSNPSVQQTQQTVITIDISNFIGSVSKAPLRNVTAEVNRALNRYAVTAKQIAKIADYIPAYEPYRYGTFCFLVYHRAPWDIKREASWEATIGTPFPGNNVPVIYYGMIMTPENLGNLTYGYLGAAFGISYDTLIGGSVGAAVVSGSLESYSGVINEFSDWDYVALGYYLYIVGEYY